MLAQLVDLSLDLLVGRALGGQLDLDGLVAGKLELGLHLDLEGEGEVLAVGDEVHALLVELGVADGIDVAIVDGDGIGLVDEVVADGRGDVVLAESVVDDRARGLALAESGEVVFLRSLGVSLLDARVDLLGIDGDGHLDAVALQCLYFSFHVAFLHTNTVVP